MSGRIRGRHPVRPSSVPDFDKKRESESHMPNKELVRLCEATVSANDEEQGGLREGREDGPELFTVLIFEQCSRAHITII